MRFNKAKVLRAAEKSLSQGKIQAAIVEYRRIVEEEPNDWTSLNMLGDLYVRTGLPEEANKLFTRVAEHYRGQGFALKAIAMYKKVLRLRPDDLAASGTLADLYAAQGLIVEARAQLLSIADSYTARSQAHEALDTLRRIADLDPLNPEVRLKVAVGYARENFRDEAADAYAEAGERFLGRQLPEAALDAFTEAITLAPLHANALAGVLSAHMQLGTPAEAAKILERACEQDAYDPTLAELLLRAYCEAENAHAAEEALKRLRALKPQDAAAQLHSLEVARLYLKANDLDATVRVLAEGTEAALNQRRDGEVLEILDEVTARDPEHLAALRLLARVHASQRDDVMLTRTLERTIEVANAASDLETETNALLRLLELAPDNATYRERLRVIGALPEEGAASSETLPRAAYDEVPTFESFMLADDATAHVETASASEAVVELENSAGTPVGNNPVADTVVDDPASSFADLGDDAQFDSARAEEGESISDYQEVAWDEQPHAAAEANAESPSASNDERLKALLDHELESVDFYIAQGYADVARDTLDMLERQYGAHASIDERRRLTATTEAGDGADADAADAFTLDNFAPQSPIAADTDEVASQPITAETFALEAGFDSSANEIDAGLASIFDEFREAVESEAPIVTADYETHYNLGIAYQEMGLADEAIEEFQKAAGIAAPGDGTPRYLQCCNMLGHCFMQKNLPQLAVMWFRKGLDTAGHTEDEYQALRYELGNAYESAGERDHALKTFMEVYGIDVSYRGVSDRVRELREQAQPVG